LGRNEGMIDEIVSKFDEVSRLKQFTS
jgi:hypothetical protein